MLEAACDNGEFLAPKTSQSATNSGVGSSKGKYKWVFATFDESDPESDGELVIDGANLYWSLLETLIGSNRAQN